MSGIRVIHKLAICWYPAHSFNPSFIFKWFVSQIWKIAGHGPKVGHFTGFWAYLHVVVFLEVVLYPGTSTSTVAVAFKSNVMSGHATCGNSAIRNSGIHTMLQQGIFFSYIFDIFIGYQAGWVGRGCYPSENCFVDQVIKFRQTCPTSLSCHFNET